MPKMKTSSATKKRFKKTAGGIKRAKAFRRHLLTKKTTKTKRQLRKTAYVSKSDEKKLLKLLPY